VPTPADGDRARDGAVESQTHVQLWRLAEVAVGPVLARDVNARERAPRAKLDRFDAYVLTRDGLANASLDQLTPTLLEVQLAGCRLRGLLLGVTTRFDKPFPLVRSQFFGRLHERSHGNPGSRALGYGA